MPLAQSYDPGTFEARLYAEWEQSGVFRPQGDGPAYTILLPPPNVTGTLHMGHAFQHTLQDALIRYHRMLGHRTLWQMGTDHAGIATEMVVSRNLALEGTGETRDSLGREGFTITEISQGGSVPDLRLVNNLDSAVLLLDGEELCVCDMAWVVGQSQNLVSHHLRQLKIAGLVTSRRQARMVMYRLTDRGRSFTEAVLAHGYRQPASEARHV